MLASYRGPPWFRVDSFTARTTNPLFAAVPFTHACTADVTA